MCGSIKEFGFKIPCEVVDGHLRLKAAKKLGIAEVPVGHRTVGCRVRRVAGARLDLSLTGFDVKEIERFLSRGPSDLWLCGPYRVQCGSATNPEDVARLLDGRKPMLMVTDPQYGISLDSEWRERAGLDGHGAAEPSYMKHRTAGHNETMISGDTRADWSEAFERS
jgi:hypothetical protein